jgi:hypothetical protein
MGVGGIEDFEGFLRIEEQLNMSSKLMGCVTCVSRSESASSRNLGEQKIFGAKEKG